MRILTLFFCVLVSLPSFAARGGGGGGGGSSRSSSVGFRTFIAAGPLISLGSVRFGYGEWEAGLLNSQSLGFDKIFSSGDYYSAFGFVVTMLGGNQMAPGFYGGVGFDPQLWTIFHLRGELNATVGSNGLTAAEADLGISLEF